MNLLRNKLGNSLLVGELSGLVDEVAAPALALEAALLLSGTSLAKQGSGPEQSPTIWFQVYLSTSWTSFGPSIHSDKVEILYSYA